MCCGTDSGLISAVNRVTLEGQTTHANKHKRRESKAMCINVLWTDRMSILCCDVPRVRSDGDPRKRAKSIPLCSMTRTQGQISAMNRTKLEEGIAKTRISWFSCRSWLMLVFVYATPVGITPVRGLWRCVCVFVFSCFPVPVRLWSWRFVVRCRVLVTVASRRPLWRIYLLLSSRFLWLMTKVQSQRENNSHIRYPANWSLFIEYIAAYSSICSPLGGYDLKNYYFEASPLKIECSKILLRIFKN